MKRKLLYWSHIERQFTKGLSFIWIDGHDPFYIKKTCFINRLDVRPTSRENKALLESGQIKVHEAPSPSRQSPWSSYFILFYFNVMLNYTHKKKGVRFLLWYAAFSKDIFEEIITEKIEGTNRKLVHCFQPSLEASFISHEVPIFLSYNLFLFLKICIFRSLKVILTLKFEL